MKIEMIMPQMGESIAEGTVLKWRKKVGDMVERDEDILELSTDKVDTEIPSPATGRIVEIRIAEGVTAPIKSVLAVIETVEEETGKPSAMESSPHDASDHGGLQVKEFKRQSAIPESPVALSVPLEKKNMFISPLVQNIATAEGIGLDVIASIPGTGKDGRLTKQDLLLYIEQKKLGITPEQASPKPAHSSPKPTIPAPVKPANGTPIWQGPGDEIIEMDRMRKLIADHMVKSAYTSPHVSSMSEVDVSSIVKHLKAFKPKFFASEGINITYTAYFIHLVAQALKEYPYMNSSIDGYKVILRRQINIGFAVELPGGGLIVPVIKGVDALSLTGVARGLNDLAVRARDGKLDPSDISGGTFTITNVGVFGNLTGTPIIHQPQVAILATGAIVKRPVVVETDSGDTIGIRPMMMMSLSYDHRLIDGALAGRFMQRVRQLMEDYQ